MNPSSVCSPRRGKTRASDEYLRRDEDAITSGTTRDRPPAALRCNVIHTVADSSRLALEPPPSAPLTKDVRDHRITTGCTYRSGWGGLSRRTSPPHNRGRSCISEASPDRPGRLIEPLDSRGRSSSAVTTSGVETRVTSLSRRRGRSSSQCRQSMARDSAQACASRMR